MTSDEFARHARAEKDAYVEMALTVPATIMTGGLIDKMGLTPEQREQMRAVLDCAPTDAYYGLLMALDGAGSLNGTQQVYELRDEHGNHLTHCGALEAAAYAAFHEDPA